jgi:hypothetical protein
MTQKKDGPEFLKQALLGVERKFLAELEHGRTGGTHMGSIGDTTESAWIKLLNEYLPGRYRASKGFAIDHLGNASDQLDCIIYDAHFTPKLWGEQGNFFVPAEAVYGTLELKQTLDASTIEDAAVKIASLRALNRTSVAKTGVLGVSAPVEPFPLIGGLVGMDASWSGGLNQTFLEQFNSLTENRRLDIVLTAKHGFCDGFSGDAEVITGEGALMRGLFRLIKALRDRATVPAIDWDQYDQALRS